MTLGRHGYDPGADGCREQFGGGDGERDFGACGDEDEVGQVLL